MDLPTTQSSKPAGGPEERGGFACGSHGPRSYMLDLRNEQTNKQASKQTNASSLFEFISLTGIPRQGSLPHSVLLDLLASQRRLAAEESEGGNMRAATQTSSDLVHKKWCLRGSWGMSFVHLLVSPKRKVLGVPRKSLCDNSLARRRPAASPGAPPPPPGAHEPRNFPSPPPASGRQEIKGPW